jgi:hypothetical protein
VVTGEKDRQCRTGLNLHRWGVRERREEMEVKTCTDQKVNMDGRKRYLLPRPLGRQQFAMLNLRGSKAAGGAGRLQG